MEMMNRNADPWEPIQPPSQSTNASSRRVDPDLRWDMFWAVDTDRNCLLILQYDKENEAQESSSLDFGVSRLTFALQTAELTTC